MNDQRLENDAKNEKDDESSTSSQSCLAEIGFMFDAEQETKSQILHFQPSKLTPYTLPQHVNEGDEGNDELCRKEFGNDNVRLGGKSDTRNMKNSISVMVDCVDDNPGAVQSGHYLWPAAPALAQFLVDIFSTVKDDPATQNPLHDRLFGHLYHSSHKDSTQPKISIIELGAGCGLAGLTAMQLPIFRNRIDSVVFTDHDPGTLQRAKGNHENTLKLMRDKSNESNEHESNEESKVFTSNNLLLDDDSSRFAIPVFFEELTWGDMKNIQNIRSRTTVESEVEKKHFDLVLGSDLIYCEEVVKPLLETAAFLMTSNQPQSAIMIMSQSFSYDVETENEINRACEEFSLNRSILFCNLETGGIRIQVFQAAQ